MRKKIISVFRDFRDDLIFEFEFNPEEMRYFRVCKNLAKQMRRYSMYENFYNNTRI